MICKHGWSFDVCAGRARQTGLFPAHKISRTKTLYHLLWNGELHFTLFELPEALNLRSRKKPRLSKRINWKSIYERIPEVAERNIFAHWDRMLHLVEKREVSLRYSPLWSVLPIAICPFGFTVKPQTQSPML